MARKSRTTEARNPDVPRDHRLRERRGRGESLYFAGSTLFMEPRSRPGETSRLLYDTCPIRPSQGTAPALEVTSHSVSSYDAAPLGVPGGPFPVADS